MKKIYIDLDGDLDASIAEIEDLINQIREYPVILAEIGAESAQARFDNYQGDTEYMDVSGYGRQPTTVTVNKQKSGKVTEVEIVASGDEVCFAEWGTGVDTDDQGKAKSNLISPPVPVYAGSYSQANGKHFREGHEYWHYRNTLFFGSYPTYGMTDTVEQLRNEAEDIARTHFR